MIAAEEPVVVAADWVMPLTTPPTHNGLVVIHDGAVVFIGSELPGRYRSARRIDLAGHAILPGLINAHCHLEFSDLIEPISAAGSFPEWIRRLISYRRSQNNAPELSKLVRRDAILTGIRESYRAGVRWIVDMTTQPWEPAWIEEAIQEIQSNSSSALGASLVPIVVQPCIEVLDITKARFAETLAFANKQIDAPELAWVGKVGLAPHAPYTTSISATQKCVELSVAAGRLVSMHLAESTDEMIWVESRSGPFQEFLQPIIEKEGAYDVGQISDYVRALIAATRTLVAHGNYLSESDLENFVTNALSMAVVHCPRTYHHFGHRHRGSTRYPLSERLLLGVKHFLGTDSRASNPDLNLWSEAQEVRADHPTVPAETILKMVTIDAAEFLGVETRCGTLRVGAPAALTAISLGRDSQFATSASTPQQAYELVLDKSSKSAPLELAIQRRT